MSDHDALLAAILANPGEDTPRLVFADWLQENGDSDRGEFIRTEVELARTPPTTEDDQRRRRVLHHRRAELLKLHRARWLAPFLPHVGDPRFERGFVSSVEASAETFLRHAEEWFGITPLNRVKFTNSFAFERDAGRRTTRVFTSPLMARLESIDLERCQLTVTDIDDFARFSTLPRLRELVLAWNALHNEGAMVLAGMAQLASLESLDVVGNKIGDAGARAIAQSKYLSGLKELRITRNPIRSKKTWALLEHRFGPAFVG